MKNMDTRFLIVIILGFLATFVNATSVNNDDDDDETELVRSRRFINVLVDLVKAFLPPTSTPVPPNYKILPPVYSRSNNVPKLSNQLPWRPPLLPIQKISIPTTGLGTGLGQVGKKPGAPTGSIPAAAGKPVLLPLPLPSLGKPPTVIPPVVNKPPKNCSCGVKKGKKVPWSCLITIPAAAEGEPSESSQCGGSVVHSQWVVTSAFCINDTKVRSGDTGILVTCGDDDDDENSKVKVDKIVQHPDFTPMYDNNIALIHLEKPLNFDKTAAPVCLPWTKGSGDCDKNGVTLISANWGSTNEDTMMTKMECLPTAKCQSIINSFLLTDNMLCGFESGRTECSPEIGGTLDSKSGQSEKHHAVGIVTFGNSCVNSGAPAVVTKVSKYLSWIMKETAVTDFCGD